MKRLLSLILVFSLLSTSLVVASAEDEITFERSGDILLLEDIGVLDKSDTEKSPESLVSRAELALTAVRLLDMSDFAEMYNGKQYFYDVSPEYTEASAIYVAVTFGIMEQVREGCFEPLTPVTADEIADVLINVLGYDKIKDTEPEAVSRVKNEILSGVTTGNGASAVRRDLYTMIENALDIDVLYVASYGADEIEWKVSGNNGILDAYFDFNSDYGIVTANGKTALKPGKNAVKGKIEVDNYEFVYNGTEDMNELLGCEVKYYWREAGNDVEIVSLAAMNDEVITIDAEDIDSFKSMTYTYWNENGKSKKADVSGAYIIYNHYSTNGAVNFKPDCGKVTLIDNDGDSDYDVVKILDYKNIYVTGVNVTQNSIYGKWGEIIKLDDLKSYSITSSAGKLTQDIAFISKGDVLSVLMAADGKNAEIVACNDVLKGTITSISHISDYEIFVDGSSYKLSQALKNSIKSGNTEAPSVGVTYKMHFDIFDEIVYMEKAEDIYTQYEYGYALAGKLSTSIVNDFQLRIFTLYGEAMDYVAADNIKIDEVRMESPQKAYSQMCKNGEDGADTGAFVPQLIRYKLNGENEVSHIDLASKEPKGSDALYIKYDVFEEIAAERVEAKGVRYASGARGFIEMDTYRTFLGVQRETKILTLDADDSSKVTADTNGGVTTATASLSSIDYNDFIAYGTDADSIKTDFILRYAAVSTSVDYLASQCIFLGSGKILDKGEEFTYMRYSDDGTEKTVTVDSDIDINSIPLYSIAGEELGKTHKLEKGDVFRFSLNSKGYAAVFEINYSLSDSKFVGADDGSDPEYGKCTSNNIARHYLYKFSTVYDKDAGGEYARLIFGDPNTFDSTTDEYFDCWLDTIFTGTGKAMAYSVSRGTVRPITKEELTDWKTYGDGAVSGLLATRTLTPLNMIIYEE